MPQRTKRNVSGFSHSDNERKKETYKRVDLEKEFGVMPFSVWDLSAALKYDNQIRREIGEVKGATTREGSGRYFGGAGKNTKFKATASYFQPFLARVIVRSYAKVGAVVYDPFSSIVRPYVAAVEGRTYFGCEIREEEADHINAVLFSRGMDDRAVVISADCCKTNPPPSVDLVFTCPPYWNLERYSDLPGDLSTLDDYAHFLNTLGRAVGLATSTLKKDGFCVLVVGDFRDYSCGRKRISRLVPFCGDVIRVVEASAGLHLYDRIVVKKPLGTAPSRVKMWNKRKTVRVHEEVLVFRRPTF